MKEILNSIKKYKEKCPKFGEKNVKNILRKGFKIAKSVIIRENAGFFIMLIFCILITVASVVYIKVTTEGMYSQQMASRWSKGGYSQISCFISDKEAITEDRINNYHHIFEKALVEDSIYLEGEKQVVSCYSARGSISIRNDNNNVEVKAIGVGGDFFLYHPIKLLKGSYYGQEEVMDDYIIVDEDVAWQLFGSSNIDGMKVYIGEVPHIIKGVVRRDTGRLNDYAGNNKGTVYVSYNTLKKYGDCKEINTFEVTLPNPVKSYAFNLVKEKVDIDEENIEIVENTERFDIDSLLKIIADFGSRSMNSKEIVYPYWENTARGYEDVFTLIITVVFLIDLCGVIWTVLFIRR